MATFSSNLSRVSWAASRLVWFVLLAAHIVWLVRPATDMQPSAASIFGLLLAILFFGLKTADVPFLRLHWDGRRLVAASLVVLAVHVRALHGWLPAGIAAEAWWIPTIAAAAVEVSRFRLNGIPSFARWLQARAVRLRSTASRPN